MNDFRLYTPTQIVFGRGAEEQAGQLIRSFGGTRVLVHYGGRSARDSGLLNRVLRCLDGAGLPHAELGGAVPNPRLSKVREGIRLCREEGVDFLLAVGGGSVIDSCKAIGYGVPREGDVWELFEGTARPAACLPIGCVLTLAAAGSEMSDSCVITNEEGWKKRGVNSDLCRLRFAALNPELTYTLPPYQTACGCTDILYHTMERYFSGPEESEPTDSMAEGLMRAVLRAAPRALEDPRDYEARACIMWAGSLSHNGLTGCGRGGNGRIGDWASHQLEHELSGMFDVAHGAGLAALWGSWARYVMDAAPERFARFARNVMGTAPGGDSREEALAGIAALENFLRSIGMPVNIRELGVELDEENIRQLACKCSFEGKRTIGSIKILDREDMEEIYRRAK